MCFNTCDNERDILPSNKVSWKYRDLNVKVADEGVAGKIRFYMVIQVCLTVYYIIEFSSLISHGFHEYYAWPLPDSTEETAEPIFRTDEESFECDGTTYYRKGYGPLYSEDFSGDAYDSITREDFFEETDSKTLELGLLVAGSITIFIFLVFLLRYLFVGHYNQLAGFVTFRTTKDGLVVPVKFAVAFTLICNIPNGAGAALLKDTCGRMSIGVIKGETEYYLMIIFIAAFVSLLSWVLMWGSCFFLCFGHDCCCAGQCTFWIVRALLIVLCLAGYALRGITFDFDFDFDLEYPRQFALSVVSAVDLVVSTLVDVHFTIPWSKFCVCCSAPVTSIEDTEDFEKSEIDSSDEEESEIDSSDEDEGNDAQQMAQMQDMYENAVEFQCEANKRRSSATPSSGQEAQVHSHLVTSKTVYVLPDGTQQIVTTVRV